MRHWAGSLSGMTARFERAFEGSIPSSGTRSASREELLLIPECDPAIIAAAGPMHELSSQTGLDVLLTKIYGRSILTVHIE